MQHSETAAVHLKELYLNVYAVILKVGPCVDSEQMFTETGSYKIVLLIRIELLQESIIGIIMNQEDG